MIQEFHLSDKRGGDHAATNGTALMPDSKPKIVVVDDDAEMNRAIERLLNAAGFCATMFPTAEALLETNTAYSAACLVLDVHLPGISGFELHNRLQQAGTNSPVIFITAHDDPTSQEQAQDAGAIAYFRKPFTGKSLLTAINRAIRPDTGSRREPKNTPLPDAEAADSPQLPPADSGVNAKNT